MLLAETKESENMDTSSKQQRTYDESERERERTLRELEEKQPSHQLFKGQIAKSWNLETEKSEERRRGAKKERRKRTRKKKVKEEERRRVT